MVTPDRDTLGAPSPPSQREMMLRAHWLRSLDDEDRERLTEMSLRAVEQAFARWAATHGGSAPVPG